MAQRAALSGATKVVVATDHASIQAACQAHQVDVVMTKAHHPTGSDRLAEACDLLGLGEHDVVVNLQGDEPLIAPTLVASVACRLAERTDCAIATAAHPIRSLDDYLSPNVVKVVTDREQRALYFSRAPIPFERDALPGFPQQLPGQWPAGLAASGAVQRHIGLYAYRVAFLRDYRQLEPSPLETLEALEQLRALWHGYRITVLSTPDAPAAGVDTPADLERVRRVLSAAR